MSMEQFEIKSDADLQKEIAAREERLASLRSKVEDGTATDEEKNEVARADQLEKQAEIKESFES